MKSVRIVSGTIVVGALVTVAAGCVAATGGSSSEPADDIVQAETSTYRLVAVEPGGALLDVDLDLDGRAAKQIVDDVDQLVGDTGNQQEPKVIVRLTNTVDGSITQWGLATDDRVTSVGDYLGRAGIARLNEEVAVVDKCYSCDTSVLCMCLKCTPIKCPAATQAAPVRKDAPTFAGLLQAHAGVVSLVAEKTYCLSCETQSNGSLKCKQITCPPT